MMLIERCLFAHVKVNEQLEGDFQSKILSSFRSQGENGLDDRFEKIKNPYR